MRFSKVDHALAKAAQKKNSPKGHPTKKHGGSPIEKTRASWNPALEKILVELLHEHNTLEYRGQNGWTSEAWNKIVKEFHEKDRYVCLTKSQIQEKEKELKREYRMLKEARKQSGASWNNQRCIIEAEPAIWNNIIISFPKAKNFRTKSFPLFEALGELYDDYEDTLAYQVQDDADATKDDNANAERLKEMPHRRVVAVPRNKEEKNPRGKRRVLA
uniref:Myb/SANT-like domain-containing protein n=1 Tax=Oryza nivara TaxID=4536 RepID=A0A0E0IHJ4_ORYNI